MLSGKPDYCVWYGEDETLCVNVLVIEAKGGAYATNPIPQLLEYIGMCWNYQRTKREREKTD